jgi:hypothetical protein
MTSGASGFTHTTTAKGEIMSSYLDRIINERRMADEAGAVAWHEIAVITCADAGDAMVTVLESTNDDNDDGYPDGEIVHWQHTESKLDDAMRRAGVCRVGVSGVIVTVLLDGEEVHA